MNCQYCKRQPYLRSSRRTVLEYVCSTLGVLPVRCRLCRRRSVQVMWTHTITVLFVMALGLGGAAFSYKYMKNRTAATRPTAPVERARSRAASTHSISINLGNVMLNEDIVRLRKAGVGQRVLIRLIETSPTRFRLAPAELVALKEAGVDDEVIDAMIGAVERSPAPPPDQGASAVPVTSASSPWSRN